MSSKQWIIGGLATTAALGGLGGVMSLAILANAHFNSDDVTFTVTDIHSLENTTECAASPSQFCTIQTDAGTFEAGGLLDYPYPSVVMQKGETYTAKRVTSAGLPSGYLIFGIQKP